MANARDEDIQTYSVRLNKFSALLFKYNHNFIKNNCIKDISDIDIDSYKILDKVVANFFIKVVNQIEMILQLCS